MKLPTLLAAAIITIISTSIFAESEWVNIAASSDYNTEWDALAGSLEFSKTKGGTPIALLVGRVTTKNTSKIELYKWYVSSADCKRKMGKIVSLGIDGDFKFENDFVFGSGNIATSMAESVCGAAEYNLRETNNKGL